MLQNTSIRTLKRAPMHHTPRWTILSSLELHQLRKRTVTYHKQEWVIKTRRKMFQICNLTDINILMNIDKSGVNTLQICTWICKQQTENRLASISMYFLSSLSSRENLSQISSLKLILLLCENTTILPIFGFYKTLGTFQWLVTSSCVGLLINCINSLKSTLVDMISCS